MHHSEGMGDAVSYALAEMSERLRVHIGESGGSAAGHLAVLQGLDAQQIYLPPRGRLVPGNLVRVDISNEYRGYWSVGGRTLVVGEPTKAQLRSYEDLLLLNAAAVGMLRPGVAAHHVFDAVCARADREQIPFWREIGVGHGLGTAEREAPFLNATDPTPLAEGMVVALDIYGYGPQRELVHSVDTHVIEADGCRRQSWYRSWDRLNRLAGASARHG
jgi:Xaa-Pro aminopeptidase